MRRVLQLVSLSGLLLTVGPSIWVFSGQLSHDAYKSIALAGTLLWLISAPFWINRNNR